MSISITTNVNTLVRLLYIVVKCPVKGGLAVHGFDAKRKQPRYLYMKGAIMDKNNKNNEHNFLSTIISLIFTICICAVMIGLTAKVLHWCLG